MPKDVTPHDPQIVLQQRLFDLLKEEEEEIDEIFALQEQGVDVNCVDGQGFTPLMYAAINAKIMAVCALRELKADFNALSPKGQSALMMVVSQKDFLFSKKEHEELTHALLDGGWDQTMEPTILCAAAQKGHVDIMQVLLDRGMNENKPDEQGHVPLVAAIVGNNCEMVRFLLDGQNQLLQPRSYERNDRDYDVLTLALECDFVSLAPHLAQAGVSFFAKDQEKNMSFMVKLMNDATFDNEDDILVVNSALAQSLKEIRKDVRSAGKWRQIGPYFSKEPVQDILNLEVILLLEESFLSRDLYKVIAQKYDDRQQSDTEINDSSESSIDDNLQQTAGLKRSPESPSGTQLKRTKTIRPGLH